MERQKYGLVFIFSLITIFGLASFALCIAAEFQRSKKKDLKLDGKWCYLPASNAFGCGLAALILLLVAQIIGNIIICKNCYYFYCSRKQRSSFKSKRSAIPIIFLSLSWISFVSGVILISAATSMNLKQPFGEGWLNGECYLVKDGVFIASGILVLLTLTSTLVSSILRINNTQLEQDKKVHHAQVE